MDFHELTGNIEQLQKRTQTIFRRAAEEEAPPRQELLQESLQELQQAFEELQVAEEELQRQNEELIDARREGEIERLRYQDLFESAPDGYLITDLNGKILDANQTAIRLLNVPYPYILKKLLPTFVAGEHRMAFRERLNRFQSPEGIDLRQAWELRLQPRYASPFFAEVSVLAAETGGGRHLRWMIRDVTARRQAQAALDESEQKFRTLAESSAAAILIIQDGKIQYASPAAVQMVGVSRETLLGKAFLDLVHPEDRGKVKVSGMEEGTNQAPLDLDGPVDTFRWELRLRATKGETCWVDLSAGPLKGFEPHAWVVTAYNITRRVQVEEARRELLRRVVEAQEEERRSIAIELHDQVGQGLSALILGLKTIENELPDPQAGRLRQLREIADALERDAHQLALNLRPAVLDDLGLIATLSSYAEEWSERWGIPVDFQTSLKNGKEIPSQVAIAAFRIVQEALANVRKHARASRVSLILSRRPDGLLVIIDDDGVGFDLDGSPSPQARGRLGLLGMRERAEQLGGELQIEAEPGGGTTLFVRLPLPRETG